MKLFLDVGAHLGETLEVVRDQRWKFDRIVCFEPASVCWPDIRARADERVEVCQFGLWREDASLVLNNPGAIGASMSAEKNGSAETEVCEFRNAASWFAANISASDEVFIKINAEGAEADILERLAFDNEIEKISHLLIHFDVRKIPSMRHREADAVRLLQMHDIEYHVAEEIQFRGIQRGTRNWLLWCHGNPRTRNLIYKTLNGRVYKVRRRLYPIKQWALKLRSS